MKTLDVESLQSGIETAVNDTDQLTEQINTVQKAVRAFHSLDDALKGQGGEAIRAFYKDTHEPFLILLHQSFIDYKSRLEEMKEAVDTFEPNSSGYISQEYLENDVEDGFDKVEETAIEMTEDANSIIESVQDLVTVTKIDESDLVDEVTKGKEKAQEVVEELTILDDYQSSQLEETKQDIQMLRSFISELDGKFKSGDLSVRSYSVEAIQDMPSYKAVMDTINNKNPETISAMYGDHIDDMPMSEIEKSKDELLNQLSKSGKEKLSQAFIDLENGEIDRAEYANILQGQIADGIEKGSTSEQFLSDLITYMNDNKGDIAEGVGKDAIVAALEQTGLATIRQSGRIVINEGIKGPEGENSFYMASEEASDKSNKYNNRGKWLGRIGKGFGGGLSVYGLYSGYTEDREENNKTVGEAVTHNAASFGAGAVGAGVATALLVSNPVGWAAVGSAAVVIGAGTVASMFFETAYDSNFLGLQDKLDWAGNQIDAGWEGTKNIANNVGEAVSDGLSAINPMNWAW